MSQPFFEIPTMRRAVTGLNLDECFDWSTMAGLRLTAYGLSREGGVTNQALGSVAVSMSQEWITPEIFTLYCNGFFIREQSTNVPVWCVLHNIRLNVNCHFVSRNYFNSYVREPRPSSKDRRFIETDFSCYSNITLRPEASNHVLWVSFTCRQYPSGR